MHFIIDFHKPYLTVLPVTAGTKGSTLILFCEHSSNQIPSFSWFKNGKQLIGNNNRTFVLANLTIADEGDYSCNVTNILGWQISNIYPVQVQCMFWTFDFFKFLIYCTRK